jgi:tape measure domain-containing protein
VASIDERVVSIKFDNAAFESKMNETIKSLDKLKTSLDFSTAKRGLDDLKTSGSTFSMSGVTNALEGISSKFTAMTAVGITALATITSHAVAAGAQIAKAFTLSPLIEGFHEYETQLNSVQTILANTASKGTTMDQVNDALQKLNEYSDQTIYNFGEMARNIGTFTAAGVDLDTSVSSIKGIANIAAMSGSSSEQAATAMYQLSQAISAGSVKLMDWNSVVNAGMGGEAFKSALFETGKAMGKLTGVPVGQSFTEWEDAGNSFRESLEKGWITSDVLTTTLSAFTGDMTEEMLLAKGFNEQQATAILKQAAIAKAAATQVKTFTQLMGTLKEAVGTGWADTFKIVIGNFEEAKELWTGVNNFLGNVIKNSSDARNTMLEGWKAMGGRTVLLQGLKDTFSGIMSVLKPIKEAFRDIFPKKTVVDLLKATAAFAEFAKKLTISGETADKVKRTFSGVFAILEIGWTVIKELVKFVGTLIHALAPVGSGLLGVSANAGDFATALNKVLVEGGGIHDFFVMLGNIAQNAIEWILKVKDAIVDLFSPDTSAVSGAVGDGIDRVGDSAEHLTGITGVLSSVWDRLQTRFQQVVGILDKVWEVFKTFASELGSKVADAFGSANFDKALDVVNVGLLGGIALLLRKFFKEGIKFDIGSGLIDKITKMFEGVTGVLKSMQTQLKSKALLNIAIAMGVLTASIVVLSLIDSGALTKALTAMTFGFGQLIGTMILLDKFVGSTGGAAKIALVAGAMIVLAVAMGILAISIKILSTLSMSELGKGLLGVGFGIGILVTAVKLMTTDKEEMVTSGLALLGLAAGLLVLSLAVKAFATMSWEEMTKGLIGIGFGLAMMTVAMRLMPNASIFQKGGFAVVAFGLKILADAVALFGVMDWGVIFKGLIGIGLAMVIIAGAMHLMPTNMLLTAPALIAVGLALGLIATAMRLMGDIDLGTLAKGILSMMVTLLILSAAMEAMQGAAGGAVALIIVAGALLILMNVIKQLGELEISTIVQGLIALAAVIAVLGLAAFLMEPLLPALLGLGIALSAVGIGIALFGIGAMFLAKSFEIMANSGVAGAKAIVESLDILIAAVPKITTAITTMLVGIFAGFLEAIPQMTELIVKALSAILDAIITLIPKAADAVIQLIDGIISVIQASFSRYVEAGLAMLLSLLTGIRDNIGQVVTVVGEIITSFIDALSVQIPAIVDSLYNLFIEVATELAYKAGEMQTAFIPIGIAFFDGLMAGLQSGVGQIFTFFTELPGKIIDIFKSLLGITSPSTVFLGFGVDIIMGLLNGLWSMLGAVMSFFTELPGKIFGWIGSIVSLLAPKAWDLIVGFMQALGEKEIEILNWFAGLPGQIIGWVGDVLRTLWSKGWDLISGMISGLIDAAVGLGSWIMELPGKIIGWLPNPLKMLFELGSQIIHGLWDGILDAKDWFMDKMGEVGGWVTNPIGKVLDVIGCPSRVMMKYGGYVIQGLVIGIEDGQNEVERASAALGNQVIDGFDENKIMDALANSMSRVPDILAGMDAFNPTITPVLDLTKVQAESSKLEDYMRLSPIKPDVSFERARLAAIPTSTESEQVPVYTGPTEITFEQNIYAPTALSTNDIYRNTKSQIVLAKEELGLK